MKGASTVSRRWIFSGLATAAWLLAACAPGATPPAAGPSGAAPKPAAPRSPASAPPAAAAPSSGLPAASPDWDKVVEEARKEGEVIIWGESGSAGREFEKDAFEKAYPGIRVNLFQAPLSSDRDSRYLQEMQAGIARVDVMISGSAGVNARVKPAGGLQSLRPFLRDDVLAAGNWRDGKLLWVDKEQQYMLMSDPVVYPPVTINDAVAQNDLQRWEDLLDPKWQGKIVMMDPRGSGPGFAAGLMMYYNPNLGPAFAEKFFGNGIVFSADQRQNLEWTDSGRTLVNVFARPKEIEDLNGVGGTVHPRQSLTASGKASASFNGSSGILFIPNLDPLPHPNAAKVYVNWFYSRAGQQAMVDVLQVTSNRVDVDMSKLPPYIIPQPGVEYMNMNDETYTATEKVQAMRDDVNKWYRAP
ncbi:MAG TPA: extracellular solute-binding protein [Chloroflexota bacterium]